MAVASGEVDFGILDASAYASFIPTGRVRALAVAGDKRLAGFPDIPTTEESGFKGFRVGSMFGVYMTGGAPVVAARRINAEINKIIAMPEISKTLVQLGLEPNPKSFEQFQKIYADDLAKWKDVVARAKLPLLD